MATNKVSQAVSVIKLPYQQTDNRQFNQFQVALSTALQPILSNPANIAITLQSVNLVSGINNVNHLLNRNLQGWVISRKREYLPGGVFTPYDVYDNYDNQPANVPKTQTIQLYCTQGTTSDPVVIDLLVF